jgi:ketosteroid isomerase-like protein
MKASIFFFLALLLVSFSSIAQETDSLRQEIERLDLAHAKAIFASDAQALDLLMDEDITVNHPTNKIINEKAELLKLIKSGVIRYTAFKRYPEKFLFFKDMVMVMGHEEVVPAKGAPNAGKKLNRRYTNVWMKKGSTWKLTVRHANNVCLEM